MKHSELRIRCSQPASRGFFSSLYYLHRSVSKEPQNCASSWPWLPPTSRQRPLLRRQKPLLPQLSRPAIFGAHTCRRTDRPTIATMAVGSEGRAPRLGPHLRGRRAVPSAERSVEMGQVTEARLKRDGANAPGCAARICEHLMRTIEPSV